MDCGNDFGECFIEATDLDQPAKAIERATVNLFGILYSSVAPLQIQARDASGRYFFEQIIEDVDISISEEIRAELLSEGKTQEEINDAIIQMQESADTTLGIIKRCRYTDKDAMVSLLREWRQGNFSTEDFNFAECETIEP